MNLKFSTIPVLTALTISCGIYPPSKSKDDTSEPSAPTDRNESEVLEFTINNFDARSGSNVTGKESKITYQLDFRADHARDYRGKAIYDEHLSGYRLKISPCIKIVHSDPKKKSRWKCKNSYSEATMFYKAPKSSRQDITLASGQEIFTLSNGEPLPVGRYNLVNSVTDYDAFAYPQLCSGDYSDVCQLQARAEVFYNDLQPFATTPEAYYPPMRGSITLEGPTNSQKWRFCHYEEPLNKCLSLK